MRLDDSRERSARRLKNALWFLFSFVAVVCMNVAVYNIGYHAGKIHGQQAKQDEINRINLELFWTRQDINDIKSSDLFSNNAAEGVKCPPKKLTGTLSKR